MAEAAEPAPLHRGLPDDIAVWEILVRLPPKSLLRCRGVCSAWRRATSTRVFLLAHHARQPSLPLLGGFHHTGDGVSLQVISFDHRADDQLQPVARLGGHNRFCLEASCDGLLVLGGLKYFICNPATRQFAPLHQLHNFKLLGMYPHSPTGEYRLLLRKYRSLDGSYVFTLGSGQLPRRIRCPDAEEDVVLSALNVVLSALIRRVVHASGSVLFRANLHWHVEQYERASNMIIVFNTATESFRQMRAPAVPGQAALFEMDGMLGMSSFNEAVATFDIWMMQDYQSEAWAFKHQIKLPVADLSLTVQFGKFRGDWKVASSRDGDVLVLVDFGGRLLHIDMDGKLVTSFQRELHFATQPRLKQTLVPHAFFPTLEGYVVNGHPFI